MGPFPCSATTCVYPAVRAKLRVEIAVGAVVQKDVPQVEDPVRKVLNARPQPELDDLEQQLFPRMIQLDGPRRAHGIERRHDAIAALELSYLLEQRRTRAPGRLERRGRESNAEALEPIRPESHRRRA